MDWPRWVFLGMEWTWSAFGLGCLILAVFYAFSYGIEERLGGWIGPVRRILETRRAPFLIWGVWVPGWIALFKVSQYHAFQLMPDSGVVANVAWNAAHGHGLLSSVIADRSYLAVHFAFTVSLLSPILWIWNSIVPLVLIQSIALGSTLLGAYLLTRDESRFPLAPWLVALLAMSQPIFHDLVGATLDDSVFAAPLFIWAVYCRRRQWKMLSASLVALLLTTREEVPFILFGVGLYLLIRNHRRGAKPAAALMAFAAAAWLAEMTVVHRARSGWINPVDHWSLYQGLGGSREAVFRTMRHAPWRFVVALVYPAAKLWTPFRILVSMALLPAASGAAFLPAFTTWLPHQIADLSGFHEMSSHTGAFLFGPLVWASARGLERLYARVRPSFRPLIAAWVLGVSGVLFFRSANFLLPAGLMPSNWRADGPKALAAIPPDAKVWCDEFFLPQLAMRRYVKILPRSLPDSSFEPGLFMPDRVLLSLHWRRLAEPSAGERILAFLKWNGFQSIFQEKDLIVLANPTAAGSEGIASSIGIP